MSLLVYTWFVLSTQESLVLIHILMSFDTHSDVFWYTFWCLFIHILMSFHTHSDVFWYTFWCLLIHILMSFDTHSHTHSDVFWYTFWCLLIHIHITLKHILKIDMTIDTDDSSCVNMSFLVYTWFFLCTHESSVLIHILMSFNTHSDVFWYTFISLWYTFWWSIWLLILMILPVYT